MKETKDQQVIDDNNDKVDAVSHFLNTYIPAEFMAHHGEAPRLTAVIHEVTRIQKNNGGNLEELGSEMVVRESFAHVLCELVYKCNETGIGQTVMVLYDIDRRCNVWRLVYTEN